MFNLVQNTVIIASLILSTALGFLEEGADRSRELTFSHSVCRSFAVRAETQITFADSTISGGDVGFSSTTSITGFYSITDGEQVTSDSGSFATSVIDAWGEAMGIRDDASPILIPEIGELTFTPGTWRAGAITIATGKTVTLDGQGDHNSKFLFQSLTTMLVGAACNIILTNGAKAENVVWVIETHFSTGAGTEFKGSVMAGTAVTFGANLVLEGSIMAKTSITLGAVNEVHGCIVALTAITFGTSNSVTVEQAVGSEIDAPAAVIYFPSLANGNDDIIIACLPLIDAAPAVCDDLAIEEAMDEVLNSCTSQGISNANARRRASGIDIPQLADIVIVPTATFDQDEAESLALNMRGVRRLVQLQCTTTDPDFMTLILCCSLPGKPSFCGSPMGNRNVLQDPKGATSSLSAAEVEQYLPFISEECSIQYQALAASYLVLNEDATCFADAGNVIDLKCHAIISTGGV